MDYRGIFVVSCIALALRPADARASQPPLGVFIHNQPGVPEAEIEAARQSIDRIFAAAGIRVVWDSRSHETPAFTVTVLLRRRDSNWSPKAKPVMGKALASDGRRGVTMLFYEAIGTVALKYNRSRSELLGIALAHEIGHVLLPYPAHSSDGLMRADWEGDDLRHAVLTGLLFTAAQADLIRRKLDAASGQPRE